ncbi:MerR family transcriptional regulator [Sphingomonas oligophenolica]|uniref:MerR family transcriptional regulator n=1 Tax=Sphingomonas oligophenolica TaxID=301154 RepID=A0A502CTT2_9SPHN|nr:MerR family transcriptional regulator [Sphingomonas oligophenolica]TPG15519.1 MerR family transcriptional regulator [Sphingomonas oligophenolica]
MTTIFDIAEVATRTGMTARALRFYEARGLIRPLRTANGRRVYGSGDLARLTAIAALKRAEFSLSDIARLLAGREVDLGRLVTAQLDALQSQSDRIAAARAMLTTVKSRIDSGEQIDVATLCSLIRQGDTLMEHQHWSGVADQYLSEDAKQDFARTRQAMPKDWDQAAYTATWDDLVARIEAALPMRPASPEAQSFYREWQALLEPFTAVATPAMKQGVSKMYDHIDEWKGDQKPPFSPAIWEFIKQVGAAHSAAEARG